MLISLAKIKRYFAPHQEMEEKLKFLFNFYPNNINLYHLAFRHKSAAKTNEYGHRISNERLEFLGDAVLGSIVAAFLFKKYPYESEGFLTEMRSKIVSREQLNKLAQKLGFKELLETDRPHKNLSKSIYGDAFEAFIGALYLDKGYDFTRDLVVQQIIRNHFNVEALELTEVNHKSKLIIWSQKNKKEIEFKVEKESMQQKTKMYHIGIYLEEKRIAQASATSIKKAEQIASRIAISKLPGNEEDKA